MAGNLGRQDILDAAEFAALATAANQTNGTQKTQIVNSLGSAVTVTGNKLDVNASFSPSGTQDVNLTKVGGAAIAIGQATSAASLPVVLPSDGTLPLPTGASTSAKQDTGNTSLTSIDGKTPALGQALAASSVPVVLTAAQLTTLTPLTGFSTSVKQSDGTQKSQVVDGSGNVIGSTANALDVNIKSNAATNQSVNLAQIAGVATATGTGIMGTGVQRVAIASDNDALTVKQATGTNLHVVLDANSGVDIGKLTANQSVNNAQVNGIAVSTGTGIMGTGVQRVAIASDNDAVTVKQATGTNLHAVLDANSGVDIGKLTANQSVNNAQVNGVAVSTGTGVMGTGVQRIAIASDNDALTVKQATAANFNAQVSGDTANAASDAGNPVKIGGVGKTANPTAVTDGQRVNAVFDKLGKQVVVGSIRDLKGIQQTTITSSTAETTVVTAVASTFLDVYGCIVTNTSATVTKVTFKDSTAGTTRFVIEVPATDTRGFMLGESAAVAQATVNNNWTATCGTSVAGVEITMLYVKNI